MRPLIESSPSLEMRFAVVLYGGSSLAIYMNGVVHELLEMVKSTAGAPGGPATYDDAEMPTGRIYREIARTICPSTPDQPLSARFTIDVLSGTSAGGINAVFLAKALANGQQLDSLRRTWFEEGDFGVLLNDSHSTKGTGLKSPGEPKSLLNGDRMYLKLSHAFDQMDVGAPRGALVDELDLFVTSTDINGDDSMLRLADGVTEEKRYKSVFHFRFEHNSCNPAPGERNDFLPDYNPVLAFASRCTSSLPFAFEPMQFRRLPGLLKTVGKDFNTRDNRWLPFMEDYRKSGRTDDDIKTIFENVSFGDGGYLDNKPFGHAINVLQNREANGPVVRKLVYIEPDPQRLNPSTFAQHHPPDALQNLFAAATSLPRYEPIRQDLQRVLDRNELIERVRALMDNTNRDTSTYYNWNAEIPRWFTTAQFLDSDLNFMVEKKGPAYGGYHRLKLKAITDELALLVTCAAGFDDSSAELQAIRQIILAWRESSYYQRLSDRTGQQQSENRFFLDFDLSYRERRLNYLLREIDVRYLNPNYQGSKTRLKELRRQVQCLASKLHEVRRELWARRTPSATAHTDLEKEVTIFQNRIRALASGTGDTPITRERLVHILNNRTDEGRRREAGRVFQAEAPSIVAVVDQLRKILASSFKQSSADVAELLPANDSIEGELRKLYDEFDNYDMVTFPLFYGTGIGEPDRVDVYRISTLDAKTLMDETTQTRRKLAGLALADLGAFLDESWRRNDYLWGRLDGAERIVEILLTDQFDPILKADFIRRLQLAVLEEELLGTESLNAISGYGTEALLAQKENVANSLAGRFREFATAQPGVPFNDRVLGVVRQSLTPAQLLEFFRAQYEVDRELNRSESLRLAARAARITGDVLQGVASQRKSTPGATILKWFMRLVLALWGIVEMALPGDYGERLARNWAAVLYICGILLIISGALFQIPGVSRVGWLAIGLTLLVHVIVMWVGGWMRRFGVTRWLMVLLRWFALVVIILFVLVAIVHDREDFIRIFQKLFADVGYWIAAHKPWR